MTIRVHVEKPVSFDALGAAWRGLECQVQDLSFFQTWTWMGCLADQRFTDPVVLRAEVDGALVGLAVFNRRGSRLFLSESGDARLDSPFVEFNRPLVAGTADTQPVLHAMLREAWRIGGVRRITLGGVAGETILAAGGTAMRIVHRESPRVDLQAIRHAGGDYLATLSANTRYQIRRSVRHYSRAGPLRLTRAADVQQALGWLEALIAMQRREWHSRGKVSAFTEPFLGQFHRSLVARGVPEGRIELLSLRAGSEQIAYLYNFRLGGHVSAYQGAIDRLAASDHAKPGLTAHLLAIERALGAGDRVYDFLAGADRYKLSLANDQRGLDWVELLAPRSMLGAALRLRNAFAGLMTSRS